MLKSVLLCRQKSLLLVVLGLFGTQYSQLLYADYTVQIGAFSKPSDAFAAPARSIGQVNTTATSNGITIFTVGDFDTMTSAKDALDSLRNDYPDAFVRNIPGSRKPVAASRPAEPTTTGMATPTPTEPKTRRLTATQGSSEDSQLWNSLTDDERKRVVYLDGVLHLKQGERFVPLAEYRREQP